MSDHAIRSASSQTARSADSHQPPARLNILLSCGILSSLLYVAMNVIAPLQWPGYNAASRVVSELSAIGAPSRTLWVVLGIVWAAVVAVFGLGIWSTARANRPLRIVGGLIIALGLFNLVPWPPMHQREVLAAGGATLTDTLHIVWSTIAVLLMLSAMAFGAAAFGRRFRFYSIATIVSLLWFGALTGVETPELQANLPTPWIGVWERIMIGAYLLWIAVLAVKLLREAPRVSPS